MRTTRPLVPPRARRAALALAAAARYACVRGPGAEIVVDLTDAAGVDEEVVSLVREHVARARQEPGDAERHATLAMVYEANELWDEARRSWDNALAQNPDRPLWRYHASICTRQAGDSEGALGSCGRSSRRTPPSPPRATAWGTCCSRPARPTAAGEQFQAAIDLAPQQPNAYVGLAEVLLREERYDEARELSERAIAMAPDYRRAHYNLGLAYRGLGRKAEAQDELNKGLNAKKDYMRDPLAQTIESYKRIALVNAPRAAPPAYFELRRRCATARRCSRRRWSTRSRR